MEASNHYPTPGLPYVQSLNSSIWGKALKYFLKLGQLEELYKPHAQLNGLEFIDALFEELSITYTLDEKELLHLPATGGFIAIANHPYGALDGLLLLQLLLKKRPDSKLLANSLLASLPNLTAFLFPVDPFNGPSKKNTSGLRQALQHLKEGLPLGVFPAGKVSRWQKGTQEIIDGPWHPSMGKLINKANVPVVPIHFSGHNSLTFHLLGLVHTKLQTSRLPAELLNKRGLQIHIRIGKPISPHNWQTLSNPERLALARAKTYSLAFPATTSQTAPVPICDETDPALIREELKQLPESRKLFTHQELDAYMARSGQIPHTLREIGRLREITFRQVGEGTNTPLDLDQYDHHYHHLFVYDRKKSRIVGAYRVGKGKEIMRKLGKRGFYLHSLFKIKKEMTPLLKHSLELGRSFVRPEYQRKPLPLLLLWKGISIFLEGKLSYQYLIGPVSISHCFSHLSRSLMVQYIQEHFYDQEMASFVKPRKQFRYTTKQTHQHPLHQQLSDVASLDELIKQIEPRRQGMPVLLKKYLLQNARIIGFNIDPAFANALDGFMVMNAEALPQKTKELFTRLAT